MLVGQTIPCCGLSRRLKGDPLSRLCHGLPGKSALIKREESERDILRELCPQLPSEVTNPAQGFIQRDTCFGLLTQKLENLRPQLDCAIQTWVGSGYVGPQLHEILGLLISCQRLAENARGFFLIRRGKLRL